MSVIVYPNKKAALEASWQMSVRSCTIRPADPKHPDPNSEWVLEIDDVAAHARRESNGNH